MSTQASPNIASPDPRVLRPVRQIALAGLALVLVWPAARGHSAWIGWLPLWLVGMPLAAWWSLYRFALPRWPVRAPHAVARRRRGPQAQRRGRRVVSRPRTRAA